MPFYSPSHRIKFPFFVCTDDNNGGGVAEYRPKAFANAHYQNCIWFSVPFCYMYTKRIEIESFRSFVPSPSHVRLCASRFVVRRCRLPLLWGKTADSYISCNEYNHNAVMRTANWGNPKPLYSVGARFSFYLFFQMSKFNRNDGFTPISMLILHCIFGKLCPKVHLEFCLGFTFILKMYSPIIFMWIVIEYARLWVWLCCNVRNVCIKMNNFLHRQPQNKNKK